MLFHKAFSLLQSAFRHHQVSIAQYRLKQNVHFFGTMADYIFESLTEKPMIPSKYEECMFFRERYKSMYYMERYERKKKKLLADQNKKQDEKSKKEGV